MVRLDSNYSLLKLDDITAEDLHSIESHARVLEFDETMDLMMLEVSEVSEADLSIMKRVHKRGRLLGVEDAGAKLFASMNSRSGNVAAMDYLSRMSGTFSAEISQSSSGSGFSFNIVMEDEK